MTEIVYVVVGYLTQPIVALAIRRSWPQEFKFLIALLLSGATGAAVTFFDSSTWNWEAWKVAFGLAFIAQQATWHLKIPGAGSPVVTEKLTDVGSG